MSAHRARQPHSAVDLARGRWARLQQLSRKQRLIAGEAVLALAGARLAVLALPFRVIQRAAGSRALDSRSPTADGPPETLARISWAISAASRRVPWRSMCLEQALAGMLMLRWHHIPATLFIGVRHADEGPERSVQAHAWVRSGSTYVTGGSDSGFAVLSRIGS